MIEEIEYRGIWFLPERTRRRIGGVLKFTPGERVSLELDGVFQNFVDFGEFFGREGVDPIIILGATPGGDEITLYKCFQKSTKGDAYSLYLADVALIGKHFKKADDIKFEQLRVRFSNLQEWANIPGPKSRRTENTKEILIHCAEPISISLSTSEDKQINLETTWSAKFARSEASVHQRTYINVSFSTAQSLNGCIKLIRSVQDFLGIAMGKPPFPMEIEARDKTSPRSKSRLRSKINVIFNPILTFDPKEKYSHEMLFTISDIKERSDSFLTNWLVKGEALKPVYNLYFSNLHSPFMYTENRFINLTQALETYHRRIFGGKYLADDDYLNGLYQLFLGVLPTTIDSDFRTSLVKGKLKYANEYSLRKRLGHLLRIFKPAFPDDIFNSSEGRYQFVGRVVDTRNYLTHYDETNKDNVAEGTDLFYLEQGLKVLMGVILLKEIGFELEEIKALITKSDAYQFYQRSNH